MKKPKLKVGTSYPVKPENGVEEFYIHGMSAQDLREAYREMMDALLTIKNTYRNNETGSMIINKSKWNKIEKALKKAGCTQNKSNRLKDIIK